MKFPMGIMNYEYAKGRESRPELIYRYKVRAVSAFDAAPLMRNGRILSLGSADGLTLKEIINMANPKEAMGIELSDDLINESIKNGVPVTKGNVENLPDTIKEAHYDVVTALAILEHLENPLACLKEVKRVLIPGGVFIASAPNPFWDDLAGRIGLHKEKEHHEQKVTKEYFKMISQEAGLQFVNFKPFMFLPSAILPYLKFSPPISLACYFDNLFQKAIPPFLFANQLFIARNPIG